jgi:hypothetical protein
MNILKLTFALMLISLTSISFAQEKHYLVIEDNNEQYDILLKIGDIGNLWSVNVVGTFTSDEKKENLTVTIGKEALANFENNLAKIHSLSKSESTCTATYLVMLTMENGEVTSYPLVTVNLDNPLQLASNL